MVQKLILLLLLGFLGMGAQLKAQNSAVMYRIAKITVDPHQLEAYSTALKEQMTKAIEMEPGVLSYTAVADKQDPARITILEVYADVAAYQSHLLTPHFKKYKEAVKDMVLSLELTDMQLVAKARKEDF